MAQIINDPYRNFGTGLGSSLGAAASEGLAGGLQMLAQNKLQKIQQRQGALGLQALGFAPDEAASLSLLDPKIQQEIVKRKLIAPQEQAYASALQQLLGGSQEQDQQNIQSLLGQSPTSQSSMSGGLNLKGGINQQQATKLTELALKKQEIAKKEKLEEQKAKERAFKETKDIRRKVTGAAKNAKEQLDNLNRFEDLEKEGKLDTPGYVNFLKESGLDIPALMNPGSEEFNKIAASFQRGARDIYGARISNFELEQFLNTIPNLSQSPEGRKRVISNMKRLNRANLEYFKTMQEIIKENKGVPPLDIEEQIEERIDPKLNKLSEQFKKDLKKEVPAGQNRFMTLLQTGAGKALTALGSGIKSTIKSVPGIASLL